MQRRCGRYPHRDRSHFRHRNGGSYLARYGELGLESTYLGYSDLLAAHCTKAQPLFSTYVLSVVQYHQDFLAMVLSTTSRRRKGQFCGIQLGLHSLHVICRNFVHHVHHDQYLPMLVSGIVMTDIEPRTNILRRPIKAYWELEPKYHYKCLNDPDIVFSASVINIFTDFLVTAIPMPLIWSLKLPARQRLAVISIFALGIFVNVAGSVRTVYVWKSMVASYDATWFGWPVLVAAAVEINLGLVCRRINTQTTCLTGTLDLLFGTSPPPSHCSFPTAPAPVHPQHQLQLQPAKPPTETSVINQPLPELSPPQHQ